jgi:hypothetical protein
LPDQGAILSYLLLVHVLTAPCHFTVLCLPLNTCALLPPIAAGHWTHLRLHLWRCLIKGPFSAISYLYTSTEVFNAWLRALGSKIGRQCWLSEMFHCAEFEMYEVEDTASVCR